MAFTREQRITAAVLGGAVATISLAVGVTAALEPHQTAWLCDDGSVSACQDIIDDARFEDVKTDDADATITQLIVDGYGVQRNHIRYVSPQGNVEDLNVRASIIAQPTDGVATDGTITDTVATARININGTVEHLWLHSNPEGDGWSGGMATSSQGHLSVYVTRQGYDNVRIERQDGSVLYVGGAWNRLESAAAQGQKLVDQRLEEERQAAEFGAAIVGGIIQGLFGF